MCVNIFLVSPHYTFKIMPKENANVKGFTKKNQPQAENQVFRKACFLTICFSTGRQQQRSSPGNDKAVANSMAKKKAQVVYLCLFLIINCHYYLCSKSNSGL
jgi:hypothetical protein